MSAPSVYRNALLLQTVLHEYRIEQVLGAGGSGITYRARDTNLDKDVAIKERHSATVAGFDLRQPAPGAGSYA